MEKNLKKIYLQVITDVCVKIAVLKICFEGKTSDSVDETFKSIFTVGVHF